MLNAGFATLTLALLDADAVADMTELGNQSRLLKLCEGTCEPRPVRFSHAQSGKEEIN
jgi:hypothetical protein